MKTLVPSTRRLVLAMVWLACVLVGASTALQTGAEPQQHRLALILTVEGAIGPATSDYLQRGLAEAETRGASLVIVRLDTPGGLASSMRDMIKAILASPIPVATYVTPSGAQAASAGTYLLYSSHIAAMAPATNLGSATPVQMGGMPGSPEQPPAEPEDASDSDSSKDGEDSQTGQDKDESGKRRGETAMERKILEDSVAYIRGLAERHGRNADWAEEAVREGANLGAREAAERGVIDLVASDIDALLEAIDGRKVQMRDGERTLETKDLQLDRFDPDWRTNLLSVITDPNIAYFLMIIGFYGLIFELANPGAMVPGVIGAICLILALFAFQVLSVNYAGLALIILGLAFIVSEAFVASFGVLGLGGIIAFVVGSVILMDGSNQEISWPIIGGTAAVAAGFMLWTVTRLVGLRGKPSNTGRDQLLGTEARVVQPFLRDQEGPAFRGKVFLMGETWRAVSRTPLENGESVRVIHTEGLEVEVERPEQAKQP